MMNMGSHSHQYALDVVPLLNECIETLHIAIDQDLFGNKKAFDDLKNVLLSCEEILHSHLSLLLESEQKNLLMGSAIIPNGSRSIMDTFCALECVLQERIRQAPQLASRRLTSKNSLTHCQKTQYSSRSATDTMMFRLIVALQLCLLRLSDYVMTGDRKPKSPCTGVDDGCILLGICLICSSIATSMAFSKNESRGIRVGKATTNKSILSLGGLILCKLVHSRVKALWIRDKIRKSADEIEDWNRQWQTVQHRDEQRRDDCQEEPGIIDLQSRRLIEYAAQRSPSVS